MKTKILLILLLFTCGQQAVAQYYDWGVDRTQLKWNTISNDGFKVVYPDSNAVVARHVAYYLGALEQSLGEGFTHTDLRFPVVVHPENFASNGMAMWMPRRVEFLSTPAEGNHSSLWIKHLTAHEYRHVIHYNNLRQGAFKWLSYLLGEQGAAASFAFMPLHAIEGDAVLFETSAVTYGRGLQPSFSMAYRAIGDDILKGKSVEKWFSGSYRELIPDHYELGYQLTTYGYTKYGVDMWDKVFDYAATHPYVLATTRRAMKKYYNTTIPELFKETFTDLNSFWDSLPPAENHAEIISAAPMRNFTKYSHPIYIGDNSILALKEDFDRTSRFVIYDIDSDKERKAKNIGIPSSRPEYAAGRVWWSEYRRSALFHQKMDSKIVYMDIDKGGKGGKGRVRTIKGIDNALYITPIGDSKEHFAYVEYDPSGRYSIVEMMGNRELRRTPLGYLVELHGLAWDDKTEELYTIATTEDGMFLARRDGDTISALTKPAYVTLSDLRAQGGYLYFGSIASGRDEVHRLSIETNIEEQLSSSSYGAFDISAPNNRGEVALTTYNRWGYNLSRQVADVSPVTVEHSPTPRNLVNAPRVKLDVINLDTLRFTPADSLAFAAKTETKRYRKAANLINVHSWAPISYNPFELTTDINLGVTLLSQNILASTNGYLSYQYDRVDGSVIRTGLNFNGLGTPITVGASYGGAQNIYTAAVANYIDQVYTYPKVDFDTKRRYSVNGAITLPLYSMGGYFSSMFYLSAGASYSNDMVADINDGNFKYYEDINNLNSLIVSQSNTLTQSQYEQYIAAIEGIENIGYKRGLAQTSLTASYYRLARKATRDSYSPWGYSLAASYLLDPINSGFSSLVVASATGYLRGFAPNHSLRISGGYQTQIGGFRINGSPLFGYQSASMIPQGYTTSDITSDNYRAASVKYSFPLCYPEIGIPSFIFVKRVRLNLGYEYGRYDSQFSQSGYGEVYSYGGDLSFDFTAFRLPDAGTTSLTLSLYKPHDRSLYFSFGVGLPF